MVSKMPLIYSLHCFVMVIYVLVRTINPARNTSLDGHAAKN